MTSLKVRTLAKIIATLITISACTEDDSEIDTLIPEAPSTPTCFVTNIISHEVDVSTGNDGNVEVDTVDFIYEFQYDEKNLLTHLSVERREIDKSSGTTRHDVKHSIDLKRDESSFVLSSTLSSSNDPSAKFKTDFDWGINSLITTTTSPDGTFTDRREYEFEGGLMTKVLAYFNGTLNSTTEYKWQDGNIIYQKFVVESPENSEDHHITEITYEYDNAPYAYEDFELSFEGAPGYKMRSDNNIVKRDLKNFTFGGDLTTTVFESTYVYGDHGYPITKNETISTTDETGTVVQEIDHEFQYSCPISD